MYATLRTKNEIAVPNISGSLNAYEPTAGGAAYHYGDLLFAKNFALTANNGLKTVVGCSSVDKVYVDDSGLVDDASAGIISRVGYQYAATELSVDVSGTYPKLTASASAAAHSVLTVAGGGTEIAAAYT